MQKHEQAPTAETATEQAPTAETATEQATPTAETAAEQVELTIEHVGKRGVKSPEMEPTPLEVAKAFVQAGFVITDAIVNADLNKDGVTTGTERVFSLVSKGQAFNLLSENAKYVKLVKKLKVKDVGELLKFAAQLLPDADINELQERVSAILDGASNVVKSIEKVRLAFEPGILTAE